MRKTLLFAAIGLVCAITAQTQARPIHFYHADLDGLQETPPNASPAFGSMDLTFDDVTLTLTITAGSYSGLLAPVTAAHIHGPAPVGVAAGVLFPLTHTGGTTGTLSGGPFVLSAAQAGFLTSGMTYVNVHTSVFPGGEIRGQIFEVPAPGALALLGLAGVMGSRRRRA